MCLNPVKVKNRKRDFNHLFDKEYLYVPCNHCKECVESKSYDMEIRMVAEYEYTVAHGGQVYNYSLTYNDNYLPRYLGIPVLCRRDMQLFKKRLKRAYGTDGESLRIFYAGEYGHEKDRPHWHIIILTDKWFDYVELYHNVIKAWDPYSENPSYVGLPSKRVNGVYCRKSDPFNALVNSVHAMRYCAKYCFKAYNFRSYIFKRLSDFLHDNDLPLDFVFPDDDRFVFSDKKEHTLDYLVNYFSSCYRCPNNFGMCQYYGLDEDYNYKSNFSDGKSGSFLVYPISKYLKNKLFNISCIIGKDLEGKPVNITHKTKKWLDYMKKTASDLAQSQENFYICNQNFKIDKSLLPEHYPVYDYVKDYLIDLYNHCNCTLRDYFYFKLVYPSPQMCRFRPFMALQNVQSRNTFIPTIYPLEYDNIFHAVDYYDSILIPLYQQIKYFAYETFVDKYNSDQRLISLVNLTKPRFLAKLPFDKFINHKKLSIQDVKTNY